MVQTYATGTSVRECTTTKVDMLTTSYLWMIWEPTSTSECIALSPMISPLNCTCCGSDVLSTDITVATKGKERKGKEDSIYIVPLSMHKYSQSAQTWIIQFYLQITPCLHFLRKHTPDGTTTTEAADIQLQLTTHLSTLKEWKAELAKIKIYNWVAHFANLTYKIFLVSR